MVPIFALIGRPNVGKSTLFNQLTHTRNALVADLPRLTRDRKYGYGEWRGHKFIIIDTGGIDGTEEGFETHIAEQSLRAIEESDVILFIVDGRSGVMEADKNIAKHLRNCQKTTIVIANKTDGIDTESAMGDFYTMGINDILPVSALHGKGIKSLLKQIFTLLIRKGLLSENISNVETFKCWLHNKTALAKKKELSIQQSFPIKLAIVGRPNVGKSTLINRVLGEKRVVVHDMPGTTRDSIYISMTYNNRDYVLIDTAGVAKRKKTIKTIEKYSAIQALQAVKDANVVLLVVDATEGISNQDLSLLSFILKSGRSLVIAVNKWDCLSNKTRDEIKQTLNYRLSFISFVHVHFISALHGNGVSNVFKAVNETYRCATKRVNTASLTNLLHAAVNKHQPPLVRGRRIKLKYAHAGGDELPIIVIHGTQVKHLPDSYKRYLINYFRRSLEMTNVTIRIQLNETKNPFAKQRKF